MIEKTTKNQEIKQFSEISKEWWNPRGKFKILHEILPLRIEYILDNIKDKKFDNIDILDLGCGGGLTCEPLTRLGANVTGVDFIKDNIKVAKDHSKQSNLNINYIYGDIDFITFEKKFDVILILEVLEHLDDWKILINKIEKFLKPKGTIIISTINQTYLSKIFAIHIAENILGWIPKKTHNYNKLIKHEDLIEELIKNNFNIKNLKGLYFNPFSREWMLSKNLISINYFCTATLN